MPISHVLACFSAKTKKQKILQPLVILANESALQKSNDYNNNNDDTKTCAGLGVIPIFCKKKSWFLFIY